MDNSLEKIYKAGLKFLVPLTPEETYRTIVHEAIKLVSGEQGSIFLEEDEELKEIYSTVPDSPVRVRKRGFTYKAFSKRISYVINAKQLAKVHPNAVQVGVKSVIFIPLSYKNKSIGVLTIRSDKEEGFANNEPDILRLFGSMASLAIRKTQLYDEAQKALEVRDLFLSMAAHEFRTPLTTISGYTQLLVGKLSAKKNSQAKWAEELFWEVNRLTSLVNELLEISRIKGGHFHYSWRECHLNEVINRAITEFKFSYPNRNLIFENRVKKEEDVVIGDPEKLLQVISNLLDNAAKYSSPNKPVFLKLGSSSPELTITVKDLGQGIDNKDLTKVFEGFYRGGRTAGEGMGLGLFVAKTIIAEHHGTIFVRSKVDKGTTIKVELPKVKL